MQTHAVRRASSAGIPAALLVLAALATLGFPGCPDDVTRPGTGGEDPYALTMSNCWPNDDRRFWTYTTTYREIAGGEVTYVPSGQTPPSVSLDLVRGLLRESVPPGPSSVQYYFSLMFDGLKTTNSGVTGQNLLEDITPLTLAGPALAASAEDRLLARIAEARPDLRARIEARRPGLLARAGRNGALGGGTLVPRGALFLFGYAWIKGPAYIGTYGDADTMLAWKFLEADIRAGHQFQHQLVPSLANDIWLKARVEGKTSVHLPGGGRVANALQVLYLVDYGVSEATDQYGNILGAYRMFDYGMVTYAPGVGPVSDHERHLAIAGTSFSRGISEMELDLQSTGLSIRGPLAAAR